MQEFLDFMGFVGAIVGDEFVTVSAWRKKGGVLRVGAVMDRVILLHGLWMNGLEMMLLRLRLKRCGFQVVRFSYATRHADIRQNAAALAQFVAGLEAERLHFVAHSLGGLVVRQLLHDFPAQRPGRVVTLGTPHQGSLTAHRLAGHPVGRLMLDRSYCRALDGDLPPWPGERELGVIAGDLAFGLGRLVAGLEGESDGTVAVDETRIEGMSDYLVVHASHMGLLFSSTVAAQCCHFLRYGRFAAGQEAGSLCW